MIKMDDVGTNLIANSLDKMDKLASKYKKSKTTDDLIEFVYFRSDFFKVSADLTLMGIFSLNELWNCESYLSILTDELEIFHNGKYTTDEKYIKEIKAWRRNRGLYETD